MKKNTSLAKRFLGCLLLAGCQLTASQAAPQTEVRDSGITDRTEIKLRQILVTARGPEDRVSTLTADDLEIRLGGDSINEFTVDPMCSDETIEAASRFLELQPSGAEPAPRLATPMNVAFYWDSDMMDMLGQQRSIQTLRELIPTLIRDGNRGSFVVDGIILVPPTENADKLLATIVDIENDPLYFDPYWTQECRRWSEVLEGVTEESGGINLANPLARTYARQERMKAERSLDRLLAFSTSLSHLPQPKMIVYLANRLRREGGEHYFYLFKEEIPPPGYDVRERFEQVVGTISAQGVRIYTAMAAGLTMPIHQPMDCPLSYPNPAFEGGTRQLKGTLVSLALETGGRPNIDAAGDDPEVIAQRILEDMRCQYLVSFDASLVRKERRFNLEARLSSGMSPERQRELRGVKLQTAAKYAIESPAKEQERAIVSRLLNAETPGPEDSMSVSLIPLGFSKGKYDVLVQVLAEPIGFAKTTWQMSATVLSGDHPTQMSVAGDAAARVIVGGGQYIAVFESVHRLAPDAVSRIAAVASGSRFRPGDETRSAIDDDVMFSVSSEDVTWPRLKGSGAVSHISVVQPVQGAFSREMKDGSGTVQGYRPMKQGVLAHAGTRAIDPSKPTALLYLACGSKKNTSLTIRRKLEGEINVSFEEREIRLGEDRCELVQDHLVWADADGTRTDRLPAGDYEFRVEIQESGRRGGKRVGPAASAARRFRVAAPAAEGYVERAAN